MKCEEKNAAKHRTLGNVRDTQPTTLAKNRILTGDFWVRPLKYSNFRQVPRLCVFVPIHSYISPLQFVFDRREGKIRQNQNVDFENILCDSNFKFANFSRKILVESFDWLVNFKKELWTKK